MAAGSVHAEIIVVPIDESSQPDVHDLPWCDGLMTHCPYSYGLRTS
jgi:hypothetical protein